MGVSYLASCSVCRYLSQIKLFLHLTDNHWIVKPWNLARALDTHVSKSLPHILKQVLTGPKIVQKYLHDPVLFDR